MWLNYKVVAAFHESVNVVSPWSPSPRAPEGTDGRGPGTGMWFRREGPRLLLSPPFQEGGRLSPCPMRTQEGPEGARLCSWGSGGTRPAPPHPSPLPPGPQRSGGNGSVHTGAPDCGQESSRPGSPQDPGGQQTHAWEWEPSEPGLAGPLPPRLLPTGRPPGGGREARSGRARLLETRSLEEADGALGRRCFGVQPGGGCLGPWVTPPWRTGRRHRLTARGGGPPHGRPRTREKWPGTAGRPVAGGQEAEVMGPRVSGRHLCSDTRAVTPVQ